MPRYFDFMEGHLRDQQGYIVPKHQRRVLETAVLALDVMPSMRALMTAGPALKKSGIAGYNCSYVPIDSLEAFHEILYILMHGTGVGFSVEQQFTGVHSHRQRIFVHGPHSCQVGACLSHSCGSDSHVSMLY